MAGLALGTGRVAAPAGHGGLVIVFGVAIAMSLVAGDPVSTVSNVGSPLAVVGLASRRACC